MSATMTALGIDKLGPADRFRLLHELWDSLAAEVEQTPLTDAQKREIDRRLAAHAADPSAAIPWEQIEAEALARLGQ